MKRFDLYVFTYRGAVYVAAILFWIALFLLIRWMLNPRPIVCPYDPAFKHYTDWEPERDSIWMEKYIREAK